MIPSIIFTIYNKILRKYNLFNCPKKDIFIVLGVARSGTSLIMQILRALGIFIGRDKDLKNADPGNPRGYLEYKKEHKFSGKLIKQSDYKSKTLKRINRFITRIAINRFLLKINTQADNGWALKIHPDVFPLWQSHFPDFKIIIVYRDPLITAHSNIKLKNFKISFHNYILEWERLYREFIYYYGRYPSIIINYDDLLNSNKKEKVLQNLATFVGKKKIDGLERIITPKLDRSSKEIEKIMEIYPLPQSVTEVFETLEKIKA